MESILTVSDTQKVQNEHFEYIPQQFVSNASRALPYILNNAKAILLSKHASQNLEIYRSMYIMPNNKSKEYKTKTILRLYSDRLCPM